MATIIDGEATAQQIREELDPAIAAVTSAAGAPHLTTILMNENPASHTYVSMKHADCAEVGIESTDIRLDPETPAAELYEAIEQQNTDPSVDGILVQMPLPSHIDAERVLRAVDPAKDVDGFHPENVGLLVTGSPRFKPATPHGIEQLLLRSDIETEGAEAVVVGRSNIVGKPMANLLLQKSATGNATVTVCHSRTADLAVKTTAADILVAAAGVPEMIDGSMIKPGATVIDVGITRRETDDGSELVGDVEYDSASEVAGAITPVPGGVGPMTRAMLLWNTVKAAADAAGVAVSLP
jgi:methenyltetrahydrofolate cyclohydrolase (EC 3.5.4.9)/5,10-methylenetetrahydrofolate dehydrogenase (NADP+) (EC 1.5.1.5)